MVVRHAFTVDEWHRMGEAGLFGEDARVELLDGEVMELSPIGSRHGGTVNRLTRMLVNAAGVRAVVAIQNPVILDARSEPQPDVAVLAPRADDYIERHAGPDEILLLIEVADSSLIYDRDWKAPFYGRSGVRECWVVDLAAGVVEVMRGPGPDGYRDRRSLGAGAVLTIEALDGLVIAVSDLLG